MAGIGNSAGYHAVDDVLPLLPVRELCHDLLESAATIGLLAQAANPAVTPESQLSGQLGLIAAAAGQIAAICAQVLDQYNPPAAPVLIPLVDPA